MPGTPLELDAVVFGGGAAGLWLLDDLHRAGYRVLLLEAGDLGAGQTVASQGILHGGVKYSLRGLVSGSARAVRDMPLIWRRALAGEAPPDLTGTRIRAQYCHLWHGRSLRSRLAMAGARAGLRTVPHKLDAAERPGPLRSVPGAVARLDEQVIEPESFVQVLAERHDERILKIDARSGLEFTRDDGGVRLVRLLDPERGEPLDLAPRHVVLCAGAGNTALRTLLGLAPGRTQTRPLHMVTIRGRRLPTLNGHCVDGMHTRATITTTRDHTDRTVWQVGGQIAEDGAAMESTALIGHAQRELGVILPGVDLSETEWMTYRVDRAEMASPGGHRPEDVGTLAEGNVITAWPTKLVLAPRLSRQVRERLSPPAGATDGPWPPPLLRPWPRPIVSVPPWEEARPWITAS